MTTIFILISHNICYVLFHHLLLDSSESLRLKLCWRDEFVLHLHPHICSVMRIWRWYSMQSWHISSLSSFTWTDARIIITRSMDYYDTILLLGKNTFLFCWWVLKSVWQIFPHGLGQVFAGHMAWILTLLAEAIFLGLGLLFQRKVLAKYVMCESYWFTVWTVSSALPL